MLANLRTKIKYVQVGVNATTINLDWIPVRVTDVLNVQNPVRAYDTVLDNYAQFGYGERTGSFTVQDYAHNFPGGGQNPADEASKIAQVDFYMKFSATASASGDQYRIIYSAPVTNATTYVLKDWSSLAIPLNTYSWLNRQDPNYIVSKPNTWGWEWDGVSAIRFTVEVLKGTGDPTAQFYEYEAWVVVKYLRPTSTATLSNPDAGFVVFGEGTTGDYTGVSGSGWLGALNFTVMGHGVSAFDISSTGTKILDSSIVPQPMERTTSNGYFRNMITGDANLDNTVNVFDILAVKSRWGRTPASPDWIREYDVNNDSAINVFDILTIKANWGRTAP
jgi:hypothetical protein